MADRYRINALQQHHGVSEVSMTLTFTVAEGATMETIEAVADHLTSLVGTAHVPAVEVTEWYTVATVRTDGMETVLLAVDDQTMASRLVEVYGGTDYCSEEYDGDPYHLPSVVAHLNEAGLSVNCDQIMLMDRAVTPA